MRKQLELLFSIQTIDNNIKSSEMLQKQYHNDIITLESEVAQEDDQYNKEQERLKDLQKEHRNRERSLQELEEQKRKIEERLLSIKTNKEYQASLQEIENIKSMISKKEDDVIEAMDTIESAMTDLKKIEEHLNTIKLRYAEKKQQIEHELKDYLDDIEKQKEKRKIIVAEINPDVFADYKKIQGIRKGKAVALAENEQCLGCNMKIPPQVYNEAVYAEKLVMCPNCHRILFVERIYEMNK